MDTKQDVALFRQAQSDWAYKRAQEIAAIVAEEGGIRPAARKLGISAARVHQILKRLPLGPVDKPAN